MKKIFKKLSTAGMSAVLAGVMSLNAFAASSAVSYGVKYYSSADSTTYNDYEKNARAAQEIYATIPSMTSTYNPRPSKETFKESLKANVIFLNSHANITYMTFRYKYGGTFYRTDIKSGTSTDSDIGLADVDMSNVDLVTFVGCKTAASSSTINLTAAAMNSGAETAVGFKNNTYSTNTSGRKWCNAYNTYLAEGETVSEAIAQATIDTDCGITLDKESIVILGNPYNTIAPKSTKATSSESVSLSEKCKIGMAVDTSLKADDAYDLAVDLGINVSPDEFTCYVNMFHKESNTGMIVFHEYVDEGIYTSKRYVIYIEDGKVADVFGHDTDKSVSSDFIMSKYSELSTVAEAAAINLTYDNVVEEKEGCSYDYSTGKLTYLHAVLTEDEDGTIVEHVQEVAR